MKLAMTMAQAARRRMMLGAGTLFAAFLLSAGMTATPAVARLSMAAAAAAMLNQLFEIRRDARMVRTAERPLPAGHARPATSPVSCSACSSGSTEPDDDRAGTGGHTGGGRGTERAPVPVVECVLAPLRPRRNRSVRNGAR